MLTACTQKIRNENLKYKIMDLMYYHSNKMLVKKCSDLHNSLQEEICLKGVLLAKKQNLSNQLDSLKDPNSRLTDYVKLINKKLEPRIAEKSFRKLPKITN